MGVGGAERQLTILARAQVSRGVDAHVALVHDGPYSAKLAASGATVHKLSASGNHDPRIGTALLKLALSSRPDVVQTWLPQMDVFGGVAAKLARRPWVLSERSMAAAYVDRGKDRHLRAAIGSRADAIVANSPGGVAYWKPRAKRDAVLRVIPNALELDAIKAAQPVVLTLPGVPMIMFAGRFSAEKNLPTLIAALELVTKEMPVNAVFCGEGPLRDELVQNVHARGLASRVVLPGVRDDLWGIMKSAAMLVSPGFFEGQPNVVMEGAAAKCPLILSDISGHRDAMPEPAATYFDARSPEQLAAAILRGLRDPGSLEKKKADAHRIAEMHSAERASVDYDNVYSLIR